MVLDYFTLDGGTLDLKSSKALIILFCSNCGTNFARLFIPAINTTVTLSETWKNSQPVTQKKVDIMPCHNPGCMGNYDFNHIVFFAKKRFVEGSKTIDLLGAAKTEREKEEIALVCLLHLEDDVIRDLRLSCKYAGQCKAINCRDKLKTMIEEELALLAQGLTLATI